MFELRLGMLRRVCFGVSALFLGVACSGEADSTDALQEESAGDAQQAVTAGAWESWLSMPVNANGFEGAPATCLATPAGAVVVGRDRITNRFRVSQFQSNPFSAWSDFGAMTFASKPAAAALDGLFFQPEAQWNRQIAVVGRAADNRYYVRIGRLDSTPPLTSNPTVVHDWAVIPNTNYASAPAATTHGGNLIVVGRTAGNAMFLHRNPLTGPQSDPFNNANWAATVSIPALPPGWVAQGDPAVTTTSSADTAMLIVTRAVNNGQMRLYGINYTLQVFGAWTSIPLGGLTMTSEPAVEFGTALNKATVYFRAGNNRIYQSSGLHSSWQAFTSIQTNTFVSGPGAAGNFGIPGHHMAVARTANNQFMNVLSVQGEP